jgi:hypothetical protein
VPENIAVRRSISFKPRFEPPMRSILGISLLILLMPSAYATELSGVAEFERDAVCFTHVGRA